MKNEQNKIVNAIENVKLNFRRSLWEYLFRKSGAIVMTLFILMAGISGFLIYKYLYSSGWSEQKKNDYLMKAMGGGVNFNMQNFNQVVGDIKQRSSELKKSELPVVKDIFGTP